MPLSVSEALRPPRIEWGVQLYFRGLRKGPAEETVAQRFAEDKRASLDTLRTRLFHGGRKVRESSREEQGCRELREKHGAT